MKVRRLSIIALAVWVWPLFGQAIYHEILDPNLQQAIWRVFPAPDGRVWLITDPTGASGAYHIEVWDGNAVTDLGRISTPQALGVTMYPQAGDSLIGIPNASGQPVAMWATISPPTVTTACSSYALNGSATNLSPTYGPFPSFDHSFLDVVYDQSSTTSTLFTLMPPAPGKTGTCNLVPIAKTSGKVYQAMKLDNGKYMIWRWPNGLNSNPGEVCIMDILGNTTILLGYSNSVNAVVVGDSHGVNNVDFDWANQNLVATVAIGVNNDWYKCGKNGCTKFATTLGARTFEGLSGKWLTVASINSGSHIGDISLVDTDTGMFNLVFNATSSINNVSFQWLLGAGNTANGTVYFAVSTKFGQYGIPALPVHLFSAVTPGIMVNPVVTSFTADSNTITAGGNATLSWQTVGADTVSIDQGIGPVPISGTQVVSPRQATTYTLTASNAAGSATATVTINVKPPVIPVISAAVDNTRANNLTLPANGWMAIYGSNLADSVLSADASKTLPLGLGNTSVTIDGNFAQVSYVSPDQVNVHVPSTIADGGHDVMVIVSGNTSKPKTINTASVSPSLYPFASDGQTWAVVGNSQDNPVHIGQDFILWGTGLGPTVCNDVGDNPAPTSKLCPLPISPNTTLTMGKFGFAAGPVFIGAAPGWTGLYQINGTVPLIPDTGLVNVTLNLGGLYPITIQLYVAP